MLFLKGLSLRLRLMLGLAAIVAILAGVVFVTIDRVTINLEQTERMAERQIPLLDAADRMLRGTEASISALRAWVLLGDATFRDQRQAAFEQQIEPALDTLNRLLQQTDDARTERLAAITQKIERFRTLQNEIQDSAHRPQNVPARALFEEHAEPQAEIMADTLAKMVSLEKFEKPDALRRQLLLNLAETQGAVVRTVSSIRAYLLTGDERFATDVDRYWTRANTRKQELFMTDFAFTDEQKVEWQAFSAAFRAFKPYPQQVIALRAQADWNQALHRERTELLPLHRALTDQLEALRTDQQKALQQETDGLLQGNRRLLWIGWVMLAVGVLLAVVVGSSVNHSVLKSVRQLAETISGVQEDGALYRRANADSKDEIGVAAKAFNSLLASWQQMVLSVNAFVDQLVALGEQTRTANLATLDNMQEQRARTRHIAEALDNMQTVVARVTESARVNTDATGQADREANESTVIVGETRAAVAALSRELVEVSDEVGRLTADSQRIGDVLRVVQEIADQTNLLALNAAIEAARAGEVGRGFAVVAGEVRTLARRTQESVNGVSETVNSIQHRVGAVVAALGRGRQRMVDTEERSARVEEALQRIVSSIASAREMNDEILAGALHKRDVAADIHDHAGEINRFADLTVGQAENAVHSVHQLAELSSSLHLLFAEFRVTDTAQHSSDVSTSPHRAAACDDDGTELF